MSKTKKLIPKTSGELLTRVPNEFLPKGTQTKLKILEAATNTLHNHGVNGLTYEAVGQQAGLNKPLVAHHFSSKEELLKGVTRYVFSIGQDFVLQRVSSFLASPHEFLANYFSASQEWFFVYPAHGSVVATLLAQSSVSSANDFKDLTVELRKFGRSRIAGALKMLRADPQDGMRAILAHDWLLARIILSFPQKMTAKQTKEYSTNTFEIAKSILQL